MLCGSEPDKESMWQIEITKFLVFELVPLVSAADNDVFMSKTAYPRTPADGLGG